MIGKRFFLQAKRVLGKMFWLIIFLVVPISFKFTDFVSREEKCENLIEIHSIKLCYKKKVLSLSKQEVKNIGLIMSAHIITHSIIFTE